jgi:hypothetical protein
MSDITIKFFSDDAELLLKTTLEELMILPNINESIEINDIEYEVKSICYTYKDEKISDIIINTK